MVSTVVYRASQHSRPRLSGVGMRRRCCPLKPPANSHRARLAQIDAFRFRRGLRANRAQRGAFPHPIRSQSVCRSPRACRGTSAHSRTRHLEKTAADDGRSACSGAQRAGRTARVHHMVRRHGLSVNFTRPQRACCAGTANEKGGLRPLFLLQSTEAGYQALRRRAKPRPTKPAPKRASEAGSGT